MAVILVVDDAEIAQNEFRRLLEEFDHQVLSASNGKQGLDIFRKHGGSIDLILCDINMPEMNGLEMCRAIKKEFPDSKTPIAMITSEKCPESPDSAKKLGIAAWVLKPVGADRLRLLVQKLVK